MDILAGKEKEGKREQRGEARSFREPGASRRGKRAGQRTTKKKSYPQWQEDGYSARTGNRREPRRSGERRRERIARNKADLSRSDAEDSMGYRRSETVSSRSKKRKEGRKKEMEEWKRKGKNVRRWNRDKNRSDPCHISILAESRDTILFTRR